MKDSEGGAVPGISEGHEKSVEYACFFCRSGCEDQLAQEIAERYPFLDVLSPVKLRYRRVNGHPIEERVTLFPGYLFARVSDDLPFQLFRSGLIYKVLLDSNNDWRLSGPDRSFAESLFAAGGVFGFSHAYYENEKIRIVDGPLKTYSGQILRVNHRKRTAQVRISVQGTELNVWLGFELIDKQP